ncbi:3-oxoacyl-ACP reductase [Streptomyces boncukensis]|uniref:3-oxoacyl-ACP reductase n=1 Tax=Streptomyces boncukensis TaxID=2711219 RepID=A0A6G4X8G0_9ACTN|nr:3-oxoacyl-ACP reductase [Streptomyces boncukensis]NGO73137.1 3-oxoacyl-ACP reductase [Streptomyces boncukensis]
MTLHGKTAVVTGAARGLGRAEAQELARLGAGVVVNDLDEAVEDTAAQIRAAGGAATAHRGDIADLAQAEHLVALAVDTHGSLDILVNNAGILRDRMVFSMSEEEWDTVLRVHLRGHFAMTRFAAAHWRRRAKETGGPVYGRIVNTSSEAFLAGSPGQPNYAAAKGGIVGLTTSTAGALGKYGVTANALCPRARTRMTQEVFQGLAAPEDGPDPLAPEHVSPLVGYLASPAAERITGQLFVVHGGMVALMERPRVAAKFDTAGDFFSVPELDGVLTPYFAQRAPREGFAADEVLGLKKD